MQVSLSQAPAGRTRLVYLDVLRFAAIMLVLGRHAHFTILPDTWGGPALSAWKHVGWIGVDLFFTLSGFLIGSLLFAEIRRHGSLDGWRFIKRRGWKIWPAYIAYLGVTISLAFAAAARRGGISAGLDRMAGYWPGFLHVQNYWQIDPDRTGLNSTHLWSLAVEEHFYLLLPLCLIAMTATGLWRIHPLRLTLALASTFFVACLAARIVTAAGSDGFDKFALYTPTHIRMDSLMAGVLLAAIVSYRRRSVEKLRRFAPAMLTAGSAGLIAVPLLLPRESPLGSTLGYTALAAAACLLILWAWYRSTESDVPGRTVRWMAAIGAYSYGIYLWHLPYARRVCDPIEKALANLPAGAVLYAVSFVAVSVAGGVVAYYLIERPCLRWRDRHIPGRA